jgi:hypothetical protein
MALWLLELLPLRRTDWVLIANNLNILRRPALLGSVPSNSADATAAHLDRRFQQPFQVIK